MDESDLFFIMYDIDLWYIHYGSISSRNKKQSAEQLSQILKALRFFMCISPICRNLNFLGNKKSPATYVTGDFVFGFIKHMVLYSSDWYYLPGKNGHTIGITTRDTTKATRTRPVPALT